MSENAGFDLPDRPDGVVLPEWVTGGVDGAELPAVEAAVWMLGESLGLPMTDEGRESSPDLRMASTDLRVLTVGAE